MRVYICIFKSHPGSLSSVTFRSPEILAPAWIPATAGKKIEKIVKKSWSIPSLNR